MYEITVIYPGFINFFFFLLKPQKNNGFICKNDTGYIHIGKTDNRAKLKRNKKNIQRYLFTKIIENLNRNFLKMRD